MDRLLSLVEPILYGDIFDCPVTLDEIHRFCRTAITQEELAAALADEHGAGRVVAQVEGLYVLRGRSELVRARSARMAAARRSRERAQALMGLIQYLPFVRGGLVTGSVAADSARPDDDVDYLVLVHPGRIWLVFALLGTLQRLGLRRQLCVNYYLSVDHLSLPSRSPFVARELLQARPVAGRPFVERLLRRNDWITELFPNARAPRREPGGSLVQERRGTPKALAELLERALGGQLGDGAEALCRQLLHRRLRAHYRRHGRPVPPELLDRAMAGHELRFHGGDHPAAIRAALEQRLERARQQLAAP